MSNPQQRRHEADYTSGAPAASSPAPIIRPVNGRHGGAYTPGMPADTGSQTWPTAHGTTYAGTSSGIPSGQLINGGGLAIPEEEENSKSGILVMQVQSNIMTNSSATEYRETPKKLQSTLHIFDPLTKFRMLRVHVYKMPDYVYQSPDTFRHRDYAGRVFEGPQFDRYLHHNTGKLRKLIVACTDDIYQARGTSTWRRTYVRNQASLKVRIATWVIDYSDNPGSWETWFVQLLKAFPAAFAMTLCFWSTGAPMRRAFYGRYAPVAYRYHGEAKVWNNQLENRRNNTVARSYQEYRILKPRHLCFLREAQGDELHGVDIRTVEDWERTAGRGENLSYIFVAYSTEHFSHDVDADMEALHLIAETAARAAGAIAYWVAGSCMRDNAELVSDVYRIADVLRGAHDMIIAVGQPRMAHRQEKRLSTDDLLKSWGERMWTFPEVLLSPGKQIPVYTRGGDLQKPLIISKNQFAGRVWHDADESRQLIDSYLGNLGLSRLEQATIAVGCLYRRQTTQYFKGDQAYALMGLLRLRPRIDDTDSQFQAFARLSLANDSDMLLERYLCTLPVSSDQPWHNMQDAYASSLWDIYPTCQVAAICDNDTVILDGAHAASIRWKSLFSIETEVGHSWRRWLAVKLMHFNGLTFVLACIFLAAQSPSPNSYYYYYAPVVSPTLVVGVIFLFITALFGVEGYINAATVERAMFGGAFGRMNWSTNGSPLCRSYLNEHGERIATDPTTDPEVLEKVKRGKLARPGEMRVFTLIDTYNMEITLFEAIRPPVCLFLCAAEGGMQRAIGCSYDWTTQTMYRETILHHHLVLELGDGWDGTNAAANENRSVFFISTETLFYVVIVITTTIAV
ncbi:hypothetical protein Dda_7114 [Drechslerella dactyloides]|uniref:Uncharacterized protein n=1 Tax=Drechslerella dactyloides TaxID=74499 RepID=A0AAD6IV59_DREDA|nr:hypothetical protein Dda_7114 [Drechslerella dactyloides]